MKTKNYTLVELLAAMAVFSLLMMALMQFISSTQKIWLGIETKTGMFEDARIALDLMSRDIECAYYSDSSPRPYLTRGGDDNTPDELWLLTSSNIKSATCTSRICEVSYKVEDVLTNGVNVKWLRISVTGDDSGAWDFSTNPALANTTIDAYKDLVPYVTNLKFTPFLPSGTAVTASGSPYPLPYYVKIEMTVLDKGSFKKWNAMPSGADKDDFLQKNKRTFSRMAVIGKRGQPDT